MWNRWHTSKECIAKWEGELPRLSQDFPLEQALKFVDELLDLAAKQRLLRIVETLDPNPFRLGDEQSFSAFLKRRALETGFFEFFSNLGMVALKMGSQQLRVESLICYYDSNGKIREEEIGDLGEVMELYKTQFAIVEGDSPHVYHVPPLVLLGSPRQIVGINNMPGRPLVFSISMYTDIWFPRVLGIHTTQYVHLRDGSGMDNSALAKCHTPRLNQLLSDTKKLVEQYGGNWQFVTEPDRGHSWYFPMATDTGILFE